MFQSMRAFDKGLTTIPIHAVSFLPLDPSELNLPKHAWQWAKSTNFEAGLGEILLIPSSEGDLIAVLLGLGSGKKQQQDYLTLVGNLPNRLPTGFYRLGYGFSSHECVALAWALGGYHFQQYKSQRVKKRQPVLVLGEAMPAKEILDMSESLWFVRDMINFPANRLGPKELADYAGLLFERYGGVRRTIQGKKLLEEKCHLVHMVGNASAREPCLIDLTWGEADHPKVTLVGKGVVFDSGGLNVKSDTNMLNMKKDMAGAAHVLGLAAMIMACQLPVCLRVIIPAVENSIGQEAFRPGDVSPSHKGITVEIGHTDAEGRLILADALSMADEDAPDLLIDIATLTGAARVALGPDIPPFYTHDDALADDLMRLSTLTRDPMWRMPLWMPYMSMLDSSVADINNVSYSGFAGSILAALFLSRFVEKTRCWVHFDVYAWNKNAAPGRPEGGEVQVIRALFALLKERYGTKEKDGETKERG